MSNSPLSGQAKGNMDDNLPIGVEIGLSIVYTSNNIEQIEAEYYSQ